MDISKQERKLPEGFLIRQADEADLEAVTELCIASESTDSGISCFSAEELLADWHRQNFVLSTDAWVISAPSDERLDNEESHDGRKVFGYGAVWGKQEGTVFMMEGFIHPCVKRRGLGTELMEVMEKRVVEMMTKHALSSRVVLRSKINRENNDAVRLHRRNGFSPIRSFWQMEIEMDNPPDNPVVPEGLKIQNVVPGEGERAVFRALEDAFSDHWGYSPGEFFTWRSRRIDILDYDPDLWFTALKDGEIIGVVIGRQRRNTGWISQLAVRNSWRNRGIGLALLNIVLSQFFRCGYRKVGLTVDAENPTGAVNLYRRAGLRKALEFIVYEKELHHGEG